VGQRCGKQSGQNSVSLVYLDLNKWVDLASAEANNGAGQQYKLETDSLGGNPVLRGLKDGEVIRPLSANAAP
jgi:hypothetical protein